VLDRLDLMHAEHVVLMAPDISLRFGQ